MAAALVRAWGAYAHVAGIKPVETGVREGAEGEDGARLRAVSTFHVKPWPDAPYRYVRPVSPHLAARDVEARITLEPIQRFVEAFAAHATGVVVELAGGLFSPLAPGLSNADVARSLAADAVVLVAPDRLGVLHDVAASSRAAAAMGLALTGIVLSAPLYADTSTGFNAAELPLVTDLPLIASLARASDEVLARDPALIRFVQALPRRGG